MNSEMEKINLKFEELSSKLEAVSRKLLEINSLQQSGNNIGECTGHSSSYAAQPPVTDPVLQSHISPTKIFSTGSDASFASIEEFLPNPSQTFPEIPVNNLNSEDLTTQPQ